MKKIWGTDWQVVELDNDPDEEQEVTSIPCDGTDVARWVLQHDDKLYFPKQTIQQIKSGKKFSRWELQLGISESWWKSDN